MMHTSADCQQLLKTINILGGPSLRVTGTQHPASIGVDLVTIALLVRWASAIMLRYAEEAPLQHTTETYKQKLNTFNYKSFLEQVCAEMIEAKETMNVLHEDYKRALNDEITGLKHNIAEQQQNIPQHPFASPSKQNM